MDEPKRKQSLYFPVEMLAEIQSEAHRQDRSLSWVVQQAWKAARDEIAKFPSMHDVLSTPSEPPLEEEAPPPKPSEAQAFAQGRFDKLP